MTTKTDFNALQELKYFYTPETRGIVTNSEATLIRDILELEQRNDIELQNIRDMMVMLYSQMAGREADGGGHKKAMQTMDAMSAICAVIDQEKFKRG